MIMAITAQMLPMIIVPLAFLFVLLIVLINKVPKAGAWVVGGVILAAPILLYRLAMAGAGSAEAIPLLVVPASFLFVLLIIVLTKAPKAGAALVVALVVMALVGLFLALPVSHRRGEESSSVLQMRRSTDTGSGLSIVRDDLEAVHLEVSKMSSGLKQVIPPAPVLPAPVPALSPIWSEGVENEYEADIYPSKLAAVRALGARLQEWIQNLVKDVNGTLDIVLFQSGNERSLMWELERVIEQESPKIRCSIESGMRNLAQDEIGITLRFVGEKHETVPWARNQGLQLTSGLAQALVRNSDGGMTNMSQRFVEKPWVADFASFSSEHPKEHFLIARSQGACTSENEAKRQAEDAACVQLLQRLGPLPQAVPGQSPAAITPSELLEGGFVVDQFVQSFDGLSGRLWRQALLIDVSGSKLVQLAEQKAHEARSARMSWARMGLSIIGVLVLIGAIYFFLNMATMGYYEWSLRIAGIVLAIIAIISVLMIVQ